MRILQVSHNFHIVGGSDAVFFQTSELLKNMGHEVIPFCTHNDKNAASPWAQFFPSAANSGSPSAKDAARYFYNREARVKLNALLDAAGPIDVAHLHIYHGKHTPAILPALKKRGIPIVHSLHEYKLACPVYTMQRHGNNCDLCVQGSALNCIRHRCKDGSLLRSMVMTLESKFARILGDVRLVDRFICVSEFQRKIMARSGIPADKLVTLHNFVETANYTASYNNDGYLLYFGRIEKLKGLQTLIHAVARTGHKLVIAGKGSWMPELVQEIAGLPKVSYVGFQVGDQLKNLVKNASAIVVPSQWYENCPMSVLEAKACGKPVIGARIGGIPELVREHKDGFLFAPGDVDSLIRSLNRFDAADLSILARAARRDVETRFSATTHLAALMNVYATLRP